jgi:type VI secretion system FHA domain protein
MGKVLVITLDGTGESRELKTGGLTVGRAEDNDWILTDTAEAPAISRRHCRFDIASRGPAITDLGSTNGTSVNGRPIVPHRPAFLRGGETIEIGMRRLSVEVVGSDAQPLNLPRIGKQDAVPLGPGMPRPLQAPAAPSAQTVPMFQPATEQGSTDPLAGGLGEKLTPLPRGKKARPNETRKAESAPHLEAMLPRRPPESAPPLGSRDPLASLKAPIPRPQEKRAPPPPPDHDPFGLGASERVMGATTTRPETSPASRSAEPQPGSSDDPRVAFLIGAGLGPAAADDRSVEQFLDDAGRMFARMAAGLRELLAVRAIIKEQAGLDSTGISAALNNPLKHSTTGREATSALLGRQEPGYLAPLAAIEAGFRDLKAHELAVLDGVRSALDELLGLFNPEALEGKLDGTGVLGNLLQGGRRARLWELYQERYEEIARAARARFLGRVDDAFRAGYARKAHEIGAAGGRQS